MTRSCPTCRRPAVKTDNKFFPFCCERCHLVDLGRWLGEEYRIPGEPAAIASARGPDDDAQ